MASDPTTSSLTPRLRAASGSGSDSGSAGLCPGCGSRLSKGACPACALDFLLTGSSHSSDGDETPPDHRVEENVEFGRYTLKERLAAGGMGVVYIAEDRKLKRTVALKMIRGSTFADDGEIARFTLEAEAAAALDHPSIVPIYEVGRLDGQPFFTMKLIEGGTLAKKLKDHGGPLPAREVASLMAKIARAVQHAHQRGVLHRDLKPGNILIDESGTPWLTDFGLAKVANADSGLTLTKDHIGTPHYMAPEVAGGNARAVSTASDVWALGVMLWEMLCGVPPFHGPGPVEIMRRILDSEPNWPAGSRADADLVTIARRCMEKNPARRPESAGAVADELERWLRGEPIKARAVTRRERFVKWIRREPAMAALYAVLTMALFAGLFLWNRAEQAVVSLRETNSRIDEGLKIATAIRIAADARLQVPENPSRALLLALESASMMPAGGTLPESAAALTDVLQRTGGLDATAGGLRPEYNEAWATSYPDYEVAAAASPDSRWLMTVDITPPGGGGPVAAVYDLRRHDSTVPLRRWKLLEGLPLTASDIRWAWLDDSRHVVIFHSSGTAWKLQTVTGEMDAGREEATAPAVKSTMQIPLEGWQVRGIRLLAAGQGDAPLLMCTTSTGEDKTGAPQAFRYHRWRLFAGEAPALLGSSEKIETTQAIHIHPLGDGRRAAFIHPKDKAITLVIDVENPGAPPLELKGPDDTYEIWTSADGNRVAARSYQNHLWLFDLPAPGTVSDECRGTLLRWFNYSLTSAAFSPDGRWLAAGGDHPGVTLFSLESPAPPLMLPAGSRTMAMAFSRDSRWLGTGHLLRQVCVWDLAQPSPSTQPVTLAGSSTFITTVAFTADNRTVIAGGANWAVRRWPFDGKSGSAQPWHLPAGNAITCDIAVSPDGAWIASCGLPERLAAGRKGAGTILLTRSDGQVSGQLGVHEGYACAVAFSGHGKWVVSTGHDNTVKVWNLKKAVEHISSGAAGEPEPAFVLPVASRPMRRYSVAFHPGDHCLYQVNSDGMLSAWDLSREDPHAWQQEESIHSIAYLLPDVAVSPDGRWLAVARHGWDPPKADSPQDGNQVLLFDVSDYSWPPRFVTAVRGAFIEDTNVCFSADGRWMAAGGEGRGPSIWDLTAADIGASCRPAPFSAQKTTAVGFSPDGRYLAYAGNDGRLHFWNWQKPGDSFVIQTGNPILTLAWLPDGRIATAGAADHVAVWETDLQRLMATARRVAGRELSSEERTRFRIERP